MIDWTGVFLSLDHTFEDVCYLRSEISLDFVVVVVVFEDLTKDLVQVVASTNPW